MKYFILLLCIGVDLLNGMQYNQDKQKHSFYFDYAMRAVQIQDQNRLEMYCRLDAKLIPELEQEMKKEYARNMWLAEVMKKIKLQNNARL